jgi:AbrB family looped-hinge helix DNA binding protein
MKEGGEILKKRPMIMTKSNAITLPKELREEQGLQPGDCFDYDVLGDGSIRLVRKECCQTPAFRPICRMTREKQNT